MKHAQSKILFSAIVALSVFIGASNSLAQTANKLPEKKATAATEPAAPESTSSEAIKFNTDTESTSTEQRTPIQFKVPGVNDNATKGVDNKSQNSESLPADDQAFKAYIGYPKHQMSVGLMPYSISSKFSELINFNYEASNVGYEVGYKFVATPLTSFDISWSRYSADVAAATNVGGLYDITASEIDVDSITANATYCMVSGSSFFQRLCPGLTLSKDSYPILEFASGSNLIMSKVTDIVMGVNISYQVPVNDRLNINSTLGYNIGTGVGNSGVLTSEANSNLYIKIISMYNYRPQHDIHISLDYSARSAELVGKYIGGTREWESESTTIGGKVTYVHTF